MIFFEDFENIDTGYFPFVTGERPGDARTQLAERHEPYSQKGWWAVGPTGTVIENGELNDNVLRGDWSPMLNNERTGEILKTAPGAIAFEAGQRYRVSFDYQTTYEDQFRVRLGGDIVTADGVHTVNTVSTILGAEHDTTTFSAEFDAVCGQNPFIAIDKLAGANHQHNMTIDDLRIEHLGAAESAACLDASIKVAGTAQEGRDLTVTTKVTSFNETATDVAHDLDLPEGWTVTVATAGETALGFGETSTQVWTVRVPKGAEDATFTLVGAVTTDGTKSTITRTVDVSVIEPLPDGEVYLSDMRDRIVGTPVNGWGPMEWDLSNGEQGAGDGGPLSIGGVTYPKGIGTHANAEVVFALGGECTRFQAIIGINDIQTARGSVVFIVEGDGEELIRTPVQRHNDTGLEIDIDITGVKQLKLISNNAGDGSGNDHSDWALARVTCAGAQEPDPTPEPTVEPTPEPTSKPTEPTSKPTEPTVKPTPEFVRTAPYTKPGYHNLNGRRWFTTCEKYSQTERCRTDIWATTVVKTGGTFEMKQTWVFNNMTYLPLMDRAGWAGNPLATPGEHTIGGRQWFTECDTERTGRDGCRSYIYATVYSATAQPGGGYRFTQSDKWVFNNIVLFGQ